MCCVDLSEGERYGGKFTNYLAESALSLKLQRGNSQFHMIILSNIKSFSKELSAEHTPKGIVFLHVFLIWFSGNRCIISNEMITPFSLMI